MNFLELLKAIPKVGQFLSFAKTLPAVIQEMEDLLMQVEKSLDEAAAAAGFDAAPAKAAIDRIIAMLDSTQHSIEMIVGK